jgi:hypothetical protein
MACLPGCINPTTPPTSATACARRQSTASAPDRGRWCGRRPRGACNQAGDSGDGISRIAWYGVGAVVGLSLPSLLLALAGWIRYRRRRADLDAAGAEAVGELHARMANAGRDDDQMCSDGSRRCRRSGLR